MESEEQMERMEFHVHLQPVRIFVHVMLHKG